MAWLIRAARFEDAAALTAIGNAVIRDTAVTFNATPRTLDVVQSWIGGEDICLVVEQEGQVCGFLRTMPFRSGSGYARCIEHTIILEPSLQGQGAGRGLIETAADLARAQGKTQMIACISSENPAGAAFHAAVGFSPVGRLPGVGFKFGREMDLLIYQKRI